MHCSASVILDCQIQVIRCGKDFFFMTEAESSDDWAANVVIERVETAWWILDDVEPIVFESPPASPDPEDDDEGSEDDDEEDDTSTPPSAHASTLTTPSTTPASTPFDSGLSSPVSSPPLSPPSSPASIHLSIDAVVEPRRGSWSAPPRL